MNPVFQLLLLVITLAVMGVLAILLGIAEGIKLALIDEKVRTELPKARAQRKRDIDNSKVIYYVVILNIWAIYNSIVIKMLFY